MFDQQNIWQESNQVDYKGIVYWDQSMNDRPNDLCTTVQEESDSVNIHAVHTNVK